MSYIGKIKTPDNTTYLIGSTLYGTCSTAAGTAAKVVTLSDFNALTTGVTIHVKFTYSNTASSPTLNVNNTGAKNIKVHGATGVGNTPYKSWFPGEIISFTYDGTNWCVNDYKDDTWRNLKYINAADTTADLAGTGPGTGYIVYDGGSSSALKTTTSSGYASISVSPQRVVAVSASQPSLTDLPKGGIWLQLI